jgi:MbtH protein
MSMPEQDPFDSYLVVVNDEEQYSIWPEVRPLPAGWRGVGAPASKEQCLERIEQLWTDMRPRSLREAMERGTA